MLFDWFFSVVATFVINHFELFGLQQGYYHLKNRKTPDINFQKNFLYKFIRHPIQLEEKDLVTELGEAYIDYKNRIGMIIPKILTYNPL